jgi:uncharacterized OsmC-like protein
MDQQTLREVQAPLKTRYREQPAAALVTLSASGTLDSMDVVCSVSTGQALVKAGLHPASGGDGSLACSGDLLLQALVACAGVTLRAVATSMDIPVTGTVRAEGDLDFRGTLGVDRQTPVGFQAIRLIFELASSAPQDQMDKLLQLTERFCVVYQTLASGAAMTTIVNRAE